jgi:formate-dependent nitrite reductase membrane component NrfD
MSMENTNPMQNTLPSEKAMPFGTLANRLRDDTNDAPQDARYSGPTYYGKPTVKPSKYGALVWSYVYVAGLAGGAQIIATIADLVGKPRLRSVVRNGRYLAMAGPVLGAPLLIADLHTPNRWYNMMRIFRKTSPMSIGSYVLTGFSAASGLTAAAQAIGGENPHSLAQRTAGIAQIPAALTGAGMGMYTGSLLSATRSPLWAAAPRLLTARFACSAVATAAAALSLGERLNGDRRNCAPLDMLAMTATLAESAIAKASEERYRELGVASPIEGDGPQAASHKLTDTIGHMLPLACFALNAVLPKKSRTLSVVGALGVLAGGLLMRRTVMNAGNQSAANPDDYLALTQPRQAEQMMQIPDEGIDQAGEQR